MSPVGNGLVPRSHTYTASAAPATFLGEADEIAAAAAAAAAVVAAQGGLIHAEGGVDFKLKAVTVDAAGTLLEPTEAVPDVYARIGAKYGVDISKDEILHRYRRAFAAPFYNSRLRYVADGRDYWSHVAIASTGCSHPGFLSELHDYYSEKEAWKLTDENAGVAFEAMRRAGLKLAVVSNFDTRLRGIMKKLDCLEWFDALAVSAEFGAEKPNPVLFWHACEKLGVRPEETVHIGDDRRNDVWGARDAGCHAWLWLDDVVTFSEVAERVGVRVPEAN